MLFLPGVTFSHSMERTIASEAGGGGDPSLMGGGVMDGLQEETATLPSREERSRPMRKPQSQQGKKYC